MKQLPRIFQFALRLFLKLRKSDFDDIADRVEIFARGQEHVLNKTGPEKAMAVVEAAKPFVPESHSKLAGQIVRLFIEIFLIFRRQ
jgi:hypothetical protein